MRSVALKAVRLARAIRAPLCVAGGVALAAGVARRVRSRQVASAAATAAASAALASDSERWCVVGLGNPGRQYERTRHNIGFDVVDTLAATEHIPMANQRKFKAVVGVGVLASGASVVLVKPQTYMNLSGDAVRKVMKYYQIPKERLLIVSDDLDTPLGQLRLKTKGSSGGHNGLKSVQADALSGSAEYARIKCGIGRPEPGTMGVSDWVLRRFVGDEVDVAFKQAVGAAEIARACVKDGVQAAMNATNSKPGGAKKRPAKGTGRPSGAEAKGGGKGFAKGGTKKRDREAYGDGDALTPQKSKTEAVETGAETAAGNGARE